jgi:Xaa-Pro aminopeptidase
LDRLLKNDDMILIASGEPVQKPGGLDQTYDFLPHPEYFWITGVRRPEGVAAYSKDEGWVDFVTPISRDERLWEGTPEAVDGIDVKELEAWMSRKNPKRIFCFGQPNGYLKKKENPLEEAARAEIQETLNSVRRVKDSAEIELIQQIAGMANKGYQLLKNYIRPGVSERQIQIEYESEVLRAGSEKFPYGSIVGAGTNAAVLHAVPTSRVVQKGDLVLIDAGADLHDYCVDITRVFFADGQMNDQQKAIYQLVLKAQLEAISQCRPGVRWTEIHQASARVMTEGLKSLGLLKGETDSLLETGAISVFYPHGVGHMVGLKVRDVGGKYNTPPTMTCGVRLRVDLEMKENFVMTVEPGLYFVPALLDDPEVRQKYQSQVDWSEVEKWRQFGGVRIEDDIQITAKGANVLTAAVAK